MSDADRQRWDRRYAEGEYRARTHPTRLLADWLPRLPGGRALDVACGAGRNAVHLAQHGYQVDAVDISSVAQARGAQRAAELGVQVNWVCADLDEGSLPAGNYDVVVVARFLSRDLFPLLVDALAPGGHLLYETHLLTDHPEVGGPGAAHFRLRPQELLHLAHELRVLHYFEGIVHDPDSRTMCLAQLVGCRGDGGF